MRELAYKTVAWPEIKIAVRPPGLIGAENEGIEWAGNVS